jgi:hypothetical protein
MLDVGMLWVYHLWVVLTHAPDLAWPQSSTLRWTSSWTRRARAAASSRFVWRTAACTGAGPLC